MKLKINIFKAFFVKLFLKNLSRIYNICIFIEFVFCTSKIKEQLINKNKLILQLLIKNNKN